jgi:hypothetical protein
MKVNNFNASPADGALLKCVFHWRRAAFALVELLVPTSDYPIFWW